MIIPNKQLACIYCKAHVSCFSRYCHLIITQSE